MATFGEAIAIAKSQVPIDIAAFAKKKNAEILNTEPRPLSFERWVDGNRGAIEETVKVGGIIVYEYNRYDLVAEWILTTLREKSPVKSGDYVRGHTLFLNGQEVSDLKAFQLGDEITITNYVPYARKIEVGTIHGKPIKLTVAPHIYETTAQQARSRYRDVAKIEFNYRGIEGAGIISTRRGNKSDLRYPVIIIKALNG